MADFAQPKIFLDALTQVHKLQMTPQQDAETRNYYLNRDPTRDKEFTNQLCDRFVAATSLPLREMLALMESEMQGLQSISNEQSVSTKELFFSTMKFTGYNLAARMCLWSEASRQMALAGI